mmetsp:Transcript_5110/g.19118  ORF Transcript_5110/g.19118 Transcript_5110/m.19118 type:complete len:259 (+) Transcript_5110:881-1657(+)
MAMLSPFLEGPYKEIAACDSITRLCASPYGQTHLSVNSLSALTADTLASTASRQRPNRAYVCAAMCARWGDKTLLFLFSFPSARSVSSSTSTNEPNNASAACSPREGDITVVRRKASRNEGFITFLVVSSQLSLRATVTPTPRFRSGNASVRCTIACAASGWLLSKRSALCNARNAPSDSAPWYSRTSIARPLWFEVPSVVPSVVLSIVRSLFGTVQFQYRHGVKVILATPRNARRSGSSTKVARREREEYSFCFVDW